MSEKKSPPEKVLVVAAHPDDELLGCGGTIVRHVRSGDLVDILILASGATARIDATDSDTESLKNTAQKVAALLGTRKPTLIGFPDNMMDSLSLLEIVRTIESILEKTQSSIIYTHHGGDLNIDHAITHRAVLTACRPLPSSSITAIYCYETLSSTEWGSPDLARSFNPMHYVDITETIDAKINALKMYKQELKQFPHPRSLEAVKALAKLRGSQVGVRAAEAFTVLRQIKHAK